MDIDSLKLKKFCELTGWTECAIRHLINDGIWVNGREYSKVSERTIVISIKGYEAWVSHNKEEVLPAFQLR